MVIPRIFPQVKQCLQQRVIDTLFTWRFVWFFTLFFIIILGVERETHFVIKSEYCLSVKWNVFFRLLQLASSLGCRMVFIPLYLLQHQSRDRDTKAVDGGGGGGRTHGDTSMYLYSTPSLGFNCDECVWVCCRCRCRDWFRFRLSLFLLCLLYFSEMFVFLRFKDKYQMNSELAFYVCI